jgi:hypothetical protein
LTSSSGSSLSDNSASIDFGSPASVTGSPERAPPGEDLSIAQAVIRAQQQAIEEAGLGFYVASFGSVVAGGSDRLGINFGADGATWPIVAEVTPGSVADNISVPVLGARLHSIAVVDGRSVRVAGMSLDEGLTLVRSVGRP